MSSSNAKPANGVPGVKLLITATALAATLGGWAAFASSQTPTTANQTVASNNTLHLPPLPTLVAPAGSSNTTISQPATRQRALPWLPPSATTRSSR